MSNLRCLSRFPVQLYVWPNSSSACLFRYRLGGAASYENTSNYYVKPSSFSFDHVNQPHEVQQRKGTVYIHWPFCSQLCTYCNFNKYVRSDVDHQSMDKCLGREVESLLRLSGIEHVTSVYFGGGTPSLASPDTVESVLNVVSLNSLLDGSAEITLEANPTSVELAKLRDFKAAGVNRLSLGVQSLIDEDLLLLNRDHSASQAISVLKVAKDIFPGRVNVDMIFGRPKQTLKSWITELHKIVEICSNHLSVYQLTVEQGTALSKDVKLGKIVLPKLDEMADMYEAAVSLLEDEHFMRYEISNFSQEGYESQHNLAYWQGVNYIGIGPGAHSRFKSDEGYIKAVNVLEPNSWMRKVENNGHGMQLVKRITKLERLEEVVATSLRTTDGLTNEIWHQFLPDTINKVFSPQVSHLSQYFNKDLLVLDDRGLRATFKGLQVLDSLLPHCWPSLQSANFSTVMCE